ncbi:MAG TPA: PQQ-dependent sugar dehydrogenase [Aeromicrobium sp.]|nr:PQQ-dependent sugar dehydrogenase [Aeromicrobium sp.]HKY58444.1 PQQ-dependent sugar dehydrogenase [Aeromicrobium sp.]
MRARAGSPRAAGTIADGLNVPWGIVFLPDGRALVAQRDAGSIAVIDPDGKGKDRVRELGDVPGSVGQPGGEAGLLGLALHPDDDAQLFAFVSTARDERIVRIALEEDRLGEIDPILTGLPTGGRHHGGRLLFGPDGHLYVGTGEAGRPELAQERDSLGGKILRITPDGKPVDGNPFDSEVWSWGHRNVEGLAFDDEDRLWACEFGEQEVDELNLIERGGNYGWPEFEGESNDPEYISPKVTWPTSICSPSGLAITQGTAFLAALRGERLWSVPLDGADVGEPQDHFVGEYGRLRTVVVAPDESLWVTTSNTDGRGRQRNGDDRILRVVLD